MQWNDNANLLFWQFPAVVSVPVLFAEHTALSALGSRLWSCARVYHVYSKYPHILWVFKYHTLVELISKEIFLSFVAQEQHLHRRRNQIIFSLLRLWYCKDKRQVLHRANYVVTANGNVYSRPIFYLFRCNLKASNVSYWLRSGNYNQVTITQRPIKISVLLYQRYEIFCL